MVRRIPASQHTREGLTALIEGRLSTASAKNELVKHVEHHDPAWRKKLVGVATVDHPSDKQLVAHARKYFLAVDRMRPQRE